MAETEISSAKQKPGFKPGQSGNPAGKPPGTRNRVSRLLDQKAEEGAEAILAAVLGAAQTGDVRAAELVLSRCWPVPKGRRLTLSLPPVEGASDVVRALGALLREVAAGNVSAEEAQAVASLIESQRRALETVDLESRIATLEKELRK